MDQISLYYREGTSDKEYHAQIEPTTEGLWNVHFQYGRRGSSLVGGLKNPQPVTRTQAQQIFNKLVNEKESKGYRRGETGTAYTNAPITPKQERQTGVFPQLLNPIDEDEMAELVTDDNWVGQTKIDGRRLLLRLDVNCARGRSIEKTVVGINRLGFSVSIPRPIEAELLELTDSCLIDGEALGERFYAFDVLEHQGRDVRGEPYGQRFAYLEQILGSRAEPDAEHPVGCVSMATTAASKAELILALRAAGGEGVVFKNVNAPYVAGRPNAGGGALKHKFYETASCVVTAINTKRSVALGLCGESGSGQAMLGIGNVTIPPNRAIPSVGDVVEIRYLYMYKQGSIFQPTYLGVRDDIPTEDCTLDQMKFKPE